MRPAGRQINRDVRENTIAASWCERYTERRATGTECEGVVARCTAPLSWAQGGRSTGLLYFGGSGERPGGQSNMNKRIRPDTDICGLLGRIAYLLSLLQLCGHPSEINEI